MAIRLGVPQQARVLTPQQVTYWVTPFDFNLGDGNTFTVATRSANSVLHFAASGVHVVTAFDSATTATIDMGTSASAQLFMATKDIKAQTFIPITDYTATPLATTEQTIQCKLNLSGATTAGAGYVIIAYVQL